MSPSSPSSRGLRRAGAGWIEAALLVGAHLTIVNAANES